MTKIAFLVGGLEPGANGVGDYTRLLAQQLAQSGARCCLLALNDADIAMPQEAPQQQSEGMAQLRLPSVMPWSERIERASAWLDEFAPDAVSLQFVPYAFHPRGIVSGLSNHLRPLVRGRRVHVMFHELWIGTNREASLKETAIGQMQRHYVTQLLRQLRPAAIATSNGVYVATLRENGFEAEQLPLFSNIPIAENPDARELAELITPDDWTGVFFGSLHPTWQAEPLLGRLIEAARQQEKRLHLIAAGRLGGAGQAIWDEISARPNSGAKFTYLGEQSAAQISWLFRNADFGVATSPWQLIQKSSCVSSMSGHGLPVIVNRDDWHWRGKVPVTPPNDALLHRFNGNVAPLLDLPKRAPEQTLPAVAAQFLRQIQSD